MAPFEPRGGGLGEAPRRFESRALPGESMSTKEIVVVGGARTAMAEYVGTRGFGLFKDVGANDLGARAIEGALQRSRVPANRIEHVVMGNAEQTSGDALYGARHAALKAGLPIETPALTVNRICGSGIQAVVSASQ